MRANAKPIKRWTKDETDFLLKNRGKYDYNELSELLGRSYAVVYDKMHRLKIEYTDEELRMFAERKHRAQTKEKAQRKSKYPIKDREVTAATITVVLSDVYHGTRQGKKLDDIFIETAEMTHRSVEAVRKIYEENKDFIKVIEKQWESYDPPPQDRSADKNRRTGHMRNEQYR